MQLFTHLTANEIKLENFPFKRELSMEAYLIENENVLGLGGDFSDVEIIKAELSLKGARPSKGTDGRIDILAKYSQEYIGIVELKLGMLEQTHLDQLEDYLTKKEDIFKMCSESFDEEIEFEPKWIGVLIGDSIDSKLGAKIKEGYLVDGVPIAALTIQRFRGEDGNVYVVSNTYFNDTKTSKDRTKHKFNGSEYGKGRLVLEVMKDYVSKNPGVTFGSLEKQFPRACQGSRGVFSTLSDANKIIAASGRKRHFIEPHEVISLGDSSEIAICSQWGIRNIDKFIKQAKNLGYIIERC